MTYNQGKIFYSLRIGQMLDIGEQNRIYSSGVYGTVTTIMFAKVVLKEGVKEHRICTHVSPILTSIGGEPTSEYQAAGIMLGIDKFSDEKEAVQGDLSLKLTGLDPSIMGVLTDQDFVGCRVTIAQGYLNSITKAGLADLPFIRWVGVGASSSFDISNFQGTNIATIEISCKSLLQVLSERKAGRYTSDSSFRYWNNGDRSMAFVASLSSWAPEFGKEVAYRGS